MALRISTGPHLRTETTTQGIMLHVIIALMPTAIAGVYLFGIRVAGILISSVASAVLTEFLWQKLTKKPVRIHDLSCVVTGLILGLNMPSTVSWWIPAFGSAIAILIAKQFFGGLGHNFINPAMFGRAVLLASWPVAMTGSAMPHRFFGKTSANLPADAVTSATVLPSLNATGSTDYSLQDLLLGNMPGAIGEVCKVAILIGFVYLLITGVITWHIPVCFAGSAVLMGWLLGVSPMATLLSGGLLFGAVFMATDYVTNPMLRTGEIIFGILGGALVAIIRKFGAYPEGVTYAILLMNIATPLIDRCTRRKIYGEVKQHA